MSLSSKNLSAIQKAGQAVHGAFESVTETVRSYAESMVAKVTRQPFGAEAEQSIASFKGISRLSQGLAEVEAKMQELYAMANDLANPAYDVIALPASSKRKITNEAIVDAIAKPANAGKKMHAAGPRPSAFTSNDTKLLSFLRQALSATEWTYLPSSAMSAGADMPLGSVGASLRKILKSGMVLLGSRAMYKLRTKAAIAPADKPAAGPAKNAKKLGGVKVLTPATKAVKAVKVSVKAKPAKVMKKVKAAPAKKTKPPVEAPVEASTVADVAGVAPV